MRGFTLASGEWYTSHLLRSIWAPSKFSTSTGVPHRASGAEDTRPFAVGVAAGGVPARGAEEGGNGTGGGGGVSGPAGGHGVPGAPGGRDGAPCPDPYRWSYTGGGGYPGGPPGRTEAAAPGAPPGVRPATGAPPGGRLATGAACGGRDVAAAVGEAASRTAGGRPAPPEWPASGLPGPGQRVNVVAATIMYALRIDMRP
ncbi:hypothetical protein Sme01_31030 [Sphaerisporangium melleum]|uniref:Uncharacterized protein n=1 Tax=Sphaerisporangium melleum TaxID=321316 RepID=A0A917VMB5_9ACTN|nr:hypothetical protein GCM10007964_42460 [Sphaerisporangium melleum]GII70627.1 hypothetical protein Sme01_31030 [Sphaerisporangium melleum]